MTDTRLGTTAARWTGIGLSTAPTERAEAAEAVVAAYTSVGLPPPAHLVWFASPAAGARAAALLTGRRGTPAAPVDPGDDIAAALHDQGCAPTPGSAGVSVRSQVRTAPWATARQEVHAALGPDGWARLWAACGADVWRTVNDRVAAPLRAHLRAELPDALRPVLLDAVGGQHDAGWLAAFDAARPRTARPSTDPIEVAAAFDRDGFTGWTAPGAGAAVVQAAGRLAGLAGVARTAGWWWPYVNVAILTDRPVELHRDNIGRLHAADSPALRYADGFELHAWRGMPIPSALVGRLSALTFDQISGESNAELRRVMLEHYGYERYLREGNARRIGKDEAGVLWWMAIDDDEPLVMVEVINSTPEPDGTRRVYWLRVPPGTRTAREGVAWTFGLTAGDYAPLVQT